MSQKKRRQRDRVSARLDERVSARLNHEVFEVVERAAEAQRRTVSSLVRNVLEDWAKAREQEDAAA